MGYNELEQGDSLSAVRVGLATIAYADILLRSIWVIHKIRQTPVDLKEMGNPGENFAFHVRMGTMKTKTLLLDSRILCDQ